MSQAIGIAGKHSHPRVRRDQRVPTPPTGSWRLRRGMQPLYTGTYDPATGVLTWDGFDYTKVIR
jgi:hypothetical protein